MNEICREVPESFEIDHVEVGVFDDRVAEHSKQYECSEILKKSKIYIIEDETGRKGSSVVIRDSEGKEVACNDSSHTKVGDSASMVCLDAILLYNVPLSRYGKHLMGHI